MLGKAILLSVKPQYANMILNGSKSVELRRIKPKLIEKRSLVLIYASSPVKSMVGAFSVDSVVEKPLDELWDIVKETSGVTYQEYKKYFSGVNKGVGIFINDYWKFTEPISLFSIKQKNKSFNPPQSFRYATEKDLFLLDAEPEWGHSNGKIVGKSCHILNCDL
jgi:predicted transcriptional regulator